MEYSGEGFSVCTAMMTAVELTETLDTNMVAPACAEASSESTAASRAIRTVRRAPIRGAVFKVMTILLFSWC